MKIFTHEIPTIFLTYPGGQGKRHRTRLSQRGTLALRWERWRFWILIRKTFCRLIRGHKNIYNFCTEADYEIFSFSLVFPWFWNATLSRKVSQNQGKCSKIKENHKIGTIVFPGRRTALGSSLRFGKLRKLVPGEYRYFPVFCIRPIPIGISLILGRPPLPPFSRKTTDFQGK